MNRDQHDMLVDGSSLSEVPSQHEPVRRVGKRQKPLRLVRTGESPDLNALVGEVALGDQVAFARLYDAISPAVYGLALRVVRDPSRAEEVAQEVFLTVWQQATRFDSSRGSALTWILTITHRRAVDVVRHSEAAARRDNAAAIRETDFDDVSETVILRDEQTQVRKCLDALTALQHEAVKLAYFNGFTYSEVATLLKAPLPTVKTRMRDGLIRLRDCMEGVR
jgi:RNA polymerase sigma-70 factor (ECF subfamily)